MLLTLIAKRNMKQSEFIKELNTVGFGITKIANLIGTTPNTVNVALQRAKKKIK